MTRPQVSASPEAEEIAAALAELLDRLHDRDDAACWRALVEGDWVRLGEPVEPVEPVEGAALSLVDLAHVVETWGAHLRAVPFLPTLLARRHADDPPAVDRPLTFTVGTGTPWPTTTDSRTDTGTDDFAATCPVGPAEGAPADPALLAEARVLGLAEAVGVAASALDDAVRHARERTQFTVPIGSFQAVAHRLADMHRDVEIGRSLVLGAAHATDDDTARVALDEGFARARRVVEGAIQVHGGMGFTWEVRLHHLLRHVIVTAALYVPAGAAA